jgi:hypothetical protein
MVIPFKRVDKAISAWVRRPDSASALNTRTGPDSANQIKASVSGVKGLRSVACAPPRYADLVEI